MIAFIKGELVGVKEDRIVVECNGLGYNIFVPSDIPGLVHIGQEVKLYTYLNVKEDAMNLFGFLEQDDLEMFKQLITVSGVGPKGALGILSNMTANDLRIAIATEDAKSIAKAPGVGNKSAQKIIIELKSKIDLEEAILGKGAKIDQGTSVNMSSDDRNEALLALVSLGYSNAEAKRAIGRVSADISGAENLVKAALKELF